MQNNIPNWLEALQNPQTGCARPMHRKPIADIEVVFIAKHRARSWAAAVGGLLEDLEMKVLIHWDWD